MTPPARSRPAWLEKLCQYGYLSVIPGVVYVKLDEVEQAVTSQGWQPIETALRDETPVVLYMPGRVPDVGQWFESSDEGWWTSHTMPVVPTHWMPLPDPPVSGPLQETT